VERDICAYFGIDPSEVEGLTLNEIVVNVTKQAHNTRERRGTAGHWC
jgi:hypothetical protein